VVRSHIMLLRILFWGLLLLAFGYAMWRGRSDERVAASVCLLATIATRFAISPLTERYTGVEFGLLAIDMAVLGAFIAIALRSERFWPLWIAGLQLTNSMSHLMKVIEFDLVPRAYAAAAMFWSYPILLIIIVGTWRTQRRSLGEVRSAAA
jgi:hypothetical protein